MLGFKPLFIIFEISFSYLTGQQFQTIGGEDRGIFSTSTWPYLVVFCFYLTFSTSTDLASTSSNLVSTSTDHFLAVSCPFVLQPY